VNSPVTSEKDGINIKPELMENEKLYHCIFQDKILLVYKDSQGVLNCYEIEEKDLVDQVKNCDSDGNLERIFEEYIEKKNVKQ